MKGLMKNNFYAVLANAKVFSIFMIILGIFVAAVVSQSLLIGYVMTGMVGFSLNAAAVAKNEYVSKWGKYKLTLPVRRADIIKSMYLNHSFWLLIGAAFSGTVTGISWFLHGCPFDIPMDILTMFALGISISLFMGAIFFPLFYLGGTERNEVFLIISLLCAISIDLVIVTVVNDLMEPGTTSILTGLVILSASSLLAYVLSYPLTLSIFRRKEY
ncbi:hypothetical protein IMSAG249_01889 [Lachnospiraceae bacterium]|jgi:hypothetical protein|nr:ABC-2 transporter permease [Lachnospiraceae bacterium]GFI70062.1 hypothetical protein IMSAG249_01889 [Lachnospiraceae bacterium]